VNGEKGQGGKATNSGAPISASRKRSTRRDRGERVDGTAQFADGKKSVREGAELRSMSRVRWRAA